MILYIKTYPVLNTCLNIDEIKTFGMLFLRELQSQIFQHYKVTTFASTR